MMRFDLSKILSLTLVRFAVVAVMMAALPVHALDNARYFVSMPDMPIMEGLIELTEQTVVFDKPEGRIVESVAAMGQKNPQSVLKYYDDTLPQLGWARIEDRTFRREQEFLKIALETSQGQNFLRLTVAPAQ